MKAFIWEVPNSDDHSHGVAFAETVEAARSLVIADVKALAVPRELKVDIITKVMGEPDEILEPPFGYVEIGCQPEQRPGVRFLESLKTPESPSTPSDIADGSSDLKN